MTLLTSLRPWSLGAAVLSIGVCTLIGISNTSVKAIFRALGKEPHWIVQIFEQSWCIPMGALLAAAVIGKDLWCPARIAEGVNYLTCIAVISVWCIYVWAASQPGSFPMPVHMR